MNESIKPISYFGGMNTADGFRSFFSELTDRVSYSYVIKGGPGTGKSYFMNLIRTEAESRGLPVELIYCASDAKSLDGILIPSLNVGIFDGTAPHILDPILPAVSGEWIRFDSFLDKEKLEKEKTRLESLNKQKKRLYDRVKSASVIYAAAEKEILSITEDVIRKEKMTAAAGRILKKMAGRETGDIRTVQLASVGMRGTVKLTTMTDRAKERVTVFGYGASLFLSYLLRLSKEAGVPAEVSYHPIVSDTPTDLFFPSSGILFTTAEKKAEESGINMDRFLDKIKLKSNRTVLRSLKKIREQASEAMEQHFRQIAQCHFEIENIYGKSLDTDAKENYSRKLISRIFDGTEF